METLKKQKFDRLPAKEQRVAIAKDVIARLDAGKFKTLRGSFSLITKDGKDFSTWGKDRELSAKTVLQHNECQVCAKGSLVMSWVAQFNNKTIGQVYNRPIIPEIAAIFPQDMRDAMEGAFEGMVKIIAQDWPKSSIVLHAPKKVWSLRKVMNNVIRNGGEFHYQGYKFGR